MEILPEVKHTDDAAAMQMHAAPSKHLLESRAVENTVPTVTTDRTFAILSHVLSLFFSWVAPLVIYLIKKDSDQFAADNAKEALNFQITLCIGYFICFILTFILIGIFLLWILVMANLILCIMAAVKASNGITYRYPLTLRLIK